jgi:Nitrous oxide-stimulated promoter
MTPNTDSPALAGAERREARLATPRLTRELNTIGAMLRIYCRDHHGAEPHDTDGLCEECSSLFEYARKRLAGCPYGPDKPTCANCQIHCYGPQQREATRVMMRYAGPRMMWRHPLLALAHVLDGRRPAPPKPRAAARNVAPPSGEAKAPPR